ncbi:hypothetical protein MT_57061 [Pseudomonas phage phiPto-bp6g]|nr:hypothetical protein MT_57061 [Pseudomonas phage phiPto-bp6g]
MANLVSKEAQQISATDVIIYERDVWTVYGAEWTKDGLVRLTIRLAGSYFNKKIEVSCTSPIQALEL